MEWEPGQGARLFYLLTLGVLIMAGVFATYRHRLGTALQHGAIWALIFMGVMIAYGFRDTLNMQLVGGGATQVADNAVALRRERDGHFHATLDVNGQSVRFLVDTGATGMVLSRRDAQRAGLDVESLRFNLPSQTANGVIYSAPAMLGRVRLGPFEDYGVQAMVNGGDLHVSLLGMSYLNRFARVTVQGDRMILER